MIPQAMNAALDAEKTNLIRQIEWDWRDLEHKLTRAYAEHIAGNHIEARILLNEALDIEHSVTGDCKILGDLAEEWGVDHERDRR
jgi:hypothetical protein